MSSVLIDADNRNKVVDEALVEVYINNEKKVVFKCTP